MAEMDGFLRNPGFDKGQPAGVTDESLHQVIRYKGVFDIHELYKIIYDWLISRGYQVHESKYKSIALQTGGKERSFDWNAHKKVTEFVMYWINLHFQFQDLMEVEVIKDGKPKKLVRGLLLIRIQHKLEFDFGERMGRTKFHMSMVNFLTKIMWKKKIDTLWEDKLRFKCYELMNIIKETLDFMTKGNEHYDVW
jgi:hypothetical protein